MIACAPFGIIVISRSVSSSMLTETITHSLTVFAHVFSHVSVIAFEHVTFVLSECPADIRLKPITNKDNKSALLWKPEPARSPPAHFSPGSTQKSRQQRAARVLP